MNMVTYQFVHSWVICICTLIALCACTNMKTEVTGQAEFQQKAYFSLPWEKAKSNIAKTSIQDQYQIYLYAVQSIHPPMLRYADPIAEKGKLAIPFLVEQLKSSNDATTSTDILYLFKRMADLHIYYADDDSDLWNFLVVRSKPYVITDGQPPVKLIFLVDIQESNPASINSKIRLYDELCGLEISSVERVAVCKSRIRNTVSGKK